MDIDEKRKCSVEECKNLGEYKGRYGRTDGVTVIRRRPLCAWHRREKQFEKRVDFNHSVPYTGTM